MSLIIAKNKVSAERLATLETPEATDSFFPIPHFDLVNLTREAITNAGLEVIEEEHAIAAGGLRYFGGFALRGTDLEATDRQLVLGLRNAGDKAFAASVCLGNRMMVCENLCFSSDVKLARRHTTHIMRDLPRVLADAVSRVTSHWIDMGKRIEAYQQAEAENVGDLLVKLADANAIPSRDIYNVVKEFRNNRHAEFKGGSLWTLYNSITENLKGSDLSKLSKRTATVQSILDPLAKFVSIADTVKVQDAEIILPA